MKKIVITIVIFLVCVGASCQARNYYEGLRLQRELECQGLQGYERDECLKRAGMSYDEYQRQMEKRQRYNK